MGKTGFLTIFLLGVLLFSRPALACPDASDLEYLGAGSGAGCVELAGFDIPTGQGPVSVEIFGLDDADPARVAAIEAGLMRAGATLQGLGALGSDPVAVYLSPEAFSLVDELGEVDAIATRAVEPHSCVISTFPATPTDDLPYVFAHEFFHCAQMFNFTAQYHSAGAEWWVEGSAEWFASLTYPGTGKSDGVAAAFDASSPETPLTSMQDDNVVFFWWYSQHYGNDGVISLIRAMPTGGEAQNDTLAGVLDDAAFLQFSKDYMDQKITQPGGRAIASSPFIGDYYEITEDEEVELSAERFVVFRTRLKFKCGVWNLDESELIGRYEMQRQPGETWESMPPEVRSDSEGDFEYRLVDGATGPQGFRVTIDIKKEPCSQCMAANYSDGPAACLVGEWHLTSGGYGAQIQKTLERVPNMQNIDYPDIDGFLTLNADGTFTLRADDDGHLEVTTPEGETFVGEINFSFAQQGTWSINGTRLEQCYAPARDIHIDETVIDPDGISTRISMDEYLGPKRSYTTKRRFDCTPGRLEIREGGFLTPKVRWVYEK
ncbi:MAG: hypothetical protein V3V13_12820 [Paracoccaceae bacterium]